MASLKWLGEHIDTIHIGSGEVCCVNCKHFYRHYVRMESGNWPQYRPIVAGHCVYPRMKDRRVYDCCKHFVTKEDTQQAP